ncbi:hypothetical protein H6G51_09155 [Limnothrix sp. FACHB-708]|uniref:hypothetical protein n=1 Tax=Limnothrix sp. FACHB-708 TaxID=2692818 RepID=UPI0016862955|nr:hypothetical protein [Limnothrix sp. FACHB-708]MBD2553443.1 hypothetical protein [Limnothrix sp. FACHB-708]
MLVQLGDHGQNLLAGELGQIGLSRSPRHFPSYRFGLGRAAACPDREVGIMVTGVTTLVVVAID